MGFTPNQVQEMSLWEFMACSDGFSLANGGKESSGGGRELSESELADMGIEGFA
ncbi:hypothetical protein OE699_02005 [Sedimentimonas flavescens]|uniref:Uncharacterized protein n=1 Tax=Sedimentimonas flavescens TaxID=2851012 RepID=A0ABT2ZV36_9RHOB|nr:hypothetical protein [Sedimentimonas flavescens]MCV2877613.1 hypothetical protein [Sedimentimonas flavescens]